MFVHPVCPLRGNSNISEPKGKQMKAQQPDYYLQITYITYKLVTLIKHADVKVSHRK